MRDIEFAKLLSDDEVLLLLKRSVRDERAATTQVLIHFGEVDARGLFRDEGHSSMFAYAVRALHMSEPEAALRIRASRFVRKFPDALELLSRGELHLTAICLLAPVVTSQNAESLLRLARRKSKYEVQELIATHFPQPDVRSAVRKLPALVQSTPTSSRNSDAIAHASGTQLRGLSCDPVSQSPDAVRQSARTSSRNGEAIACDLGTQLLSLGCDRVSQSPGAVRQSATTSLGNGEAIARDLCSAHNVLEVEKELGRDRMKRRIHDRKLARKSLREEPRSSPLAGASRNAVSRLCANHDQPGG